ncbi:MAG: hypothetical protein ACRC56_00090, partial [Bosea sp. (in: a-proteobacteria)]
NRFLGHLMQSGISFQLRQSWEETLSVDFVCRERLIEVEFFDHHIEYSFFLLDRSEQQDCPWLVGQVQWNTEIIAAADKQLKLRGIRDLVPLLVFLKSKRQYFRLETTPANGVNVAIAMPGKRIDVEVFETHVEYRYFTGDEAVDDDQDWLFGMIAGTASGLPYRPPESQ